MKTIRVGLFLFLAVIVSQFLFAPSGAFITAQGNGHTLFLPLVNGGVNRVVIPETTEVLGSATLAQLSHVSTDNTQFVFSQNTPELVDVQVGDIIVGEPTQEAPDGFLRRVTNKSVSAGQVVLGTEQATLEDAITDGGMSISISLSPDLID